MPTRKQPNVADKQLAGINIVEAKRKWREGLPVTMKEMAVGFEVGYSTIRQYSKMPGFPMLKGHVFPRLFDSWLKECFRAQSSGASAIPEGAMAQETGNGVGPTLGTLSAARLPIQAQRLLEVAGIRK